MTESVQTIRTLPSELETQDWLVAYVAQLLEVDEDEIDVGTSFKRYGLDSSMTLGLISDLESWLECDLEPTLVYNYPTIKSLAKHVSTFQPKG